MLNRKLSWKAVVYLWTILIGAASFEALAYEAIEVKDGGSVRGEVKFIGTPPKLEPIKVTKNPEHCGNTIPAENLVVSQDGGIKYVIITIEDIAKGKALDINQNLLLDNKDCFFTPHVQVVPLEAKLMVKNSDPILHNTHAYLMETDSTVFNLALPLQGQIIPRKLKKSGMMQIKCDAHNWMNSYVLVAENPYYAVTDGSGSFLITDIPPGTYKLKAWHETLGEQTQQVTVAANQESAVKFEFTLPKK